MLARSVFSLSHSRIAWICLLFLGLSAICAQAEPVPLTNTNGVSIQAEILDYDHTTGTVTGDRVGGNKFTISMDELDLKSKALVFMSPPAMEDLQTWQPPVATAGIILLAIFGIFFVVDFLGYWPGVAMVQGSWGMFQHLKVFTILFAITFVAELIQGLITGISGNASMAIDCILGAITFFLSVTLMNALYAMYNWFLALFALIASVVSRVVVYIAIAGGFFAADYYQVFDGNGFLTDWVLKPLHLM